VRRHLSLASQPDAKEATQLALSSQGNALFAALSGFFAAAGADPGVLFSPVSLLVGGVGSGTFAYDGRCRQPGRDAKRPRGFQDEVPLVARVAVPGSLAALSIACAFQPGTSLLAASRAGVSVAKSQGKKERARMIDALAGLGARFLHEPGLKKELLTRFGPTEQGNWGPADLIMSGDIQQVPVLGGSAEQEGLTLPWNNADDKLSDMLAKEAWGRSHCIVAVDAAGLFVALSYRALPDELYIDEFELSMPTFAVPVLRGVPRVAPGEALRTPAALFLDRDESGAMSGVRAIPSAEAEPLCLVRDAETREVFAA